MLQRRRRPERPHPAAMVARLMVLGLSLAVAPCLSGCSGTSEAAGVRPADQQDPRLAAIEFGMVSLGEVAWDGFTMPVVAGDGSAIAVQVDSVPDWPTRMGTTDDPRRNAGSVAMHAIGDRGLGPPRTVGPDLLLGRSWIDGEGGGAVVEEPRPGGSRRLGVMSPLDGSVQWLLDDGATNVGASIVAQGDRVVMAWCRRSPGTRAWSIEQAAFERLRGSWLPCAEGAGPPVAQVDGVDWSGPCLIDGVLSAIQLRDGVLRAVAFDASPARSEPAPIRNALLSMRGSRELAWQCVNALGPTCTVGSSAVLYHPRFGRLATWRPGSDDAPTLLPEETTGLLLCGTRCLWSTGDRVWTCTGPVPDPDRRVLVAEGTWILMQARDGCALIARPNGRSLRIVRLSFVAPDSG